MDVDIVLPLSTTYLGAKGSVWQGGGRDKQREERNKQGGIRATRARWRAWRGVPILVPTPGRASASRLVTRCGGSMDDSVPSPAHFTPGACPGAPAQVLASDSLFGAPVLASFGASLLAGSVLTAMSLTAIPAGLGAQDHVSLLPPMEWRSIGPDRGGRSIAVAGHAERPFEYYFGATGGGLFKTTDGGSTWAPVTDGQVGSASVGAVAMAPSDPDIVYIGMGEVQLRANVLQGDGVYRSDDAGKSWRHLGLADTHAIGRIRVHPTDPDRVYVAALGHPFGPNPERGVFRTTDGGRTWEKVLFRDERTGAVDLVMDPVDPDVLYATLWQVYRKPWRLWSGGEGSGIFKSTDGGDTWGELTRNPGLPAGVLGKITVTVSGADPDRVWANVEAERGGLYRSDDGGRSWELVNGHRDIWQRAFYFQRLEADPLDRNTLYILNFRLMRSTDGGRTLESVPETHADHHDLWIDPVNPLRMINGNDGGGVVTVNGGRTWTSMRYPTAQIYRLATTADFPYHVCGAQQDNSTVCVSSEPGHLRDPRRREHGVDVRGGRRRERLRRAAPRRPRHLLRGRDKHAHPLRPGDRPGYGHPAVAAHRHGRARAGHARAMELDLPDRGGAGVAPRAVRRIAAPVEVRRRGPFVGEDQPGSDARRPGDARRLRRPDREGPGRAGDLRHAVLDRAFSA